MEVMVGSTFASRSPCVVPPPDNHGPVSPSLFLKEKEDGGVNETQISKTIGSSVGTSGLEKSSGHCSDNYSSSIGTPDCSDNEEDEEVDSVFSSNSALGSLSSLEDSLPIKRGLSSFFTGKSKSFGNLSDVSSVSSMKDVEKQENPFNKRRRILMVSKLSRRSSFYSWANPKSMPLLTLNEDDDQEEEDEQNTVASSLSYRHGEMKFKTSFKSQSCYCLADLQEEGDVNDN